MDSTDSSLTGTAQTIALTPFRVVGEALIDVVDAGAHEHVGGSPLNVAVALARLGDRVELVTALGSDARGSAIIAHLDESKVQVDVRGLLSRTSTATAQVNRNGAAEYSFDISWSLDSMPTAPTRWVHVGSIGCWLAPGADVVHKTLRETDQAVILSLDPNIRSALTDERAALVRARIAELVELADIVKLSDEDSRWLFGDDSDEVLDSLLASGPAIAVMTRGSVGSTLQSTASRVEVVSPPTVVADTIGAGDSYMGGLIHAISRIRSDSLDLTLRPLSRAELMRVGQFASDVAAHTVSRPGADPPWARELELDFGRT